MLDNIENNEKKYVEKGWAAMQQSLDDAMPVAVLIPKSGFCWNWVFGILAMVLAGVGLYFTMKSDRDSTLSLASQKLFLADKMTEIAEKTPDLTQKQVLSNEKESSVPSIFVEKKSENAIRNRQNAASKSAINQPETAKVFTEKTAIDFSKSTLIAENKVGSNDKTTPIFTIVSTKNEPLKTDFFGEKVVQNIGNLTEKSNPNLTLTTKNEPSINPLETAIFKKIAAFEILENRSFLTLKSAILTPILIEKFTRPVDLFHQNKWRIGVTASLQTIDFQRINGFSTGVSVDYRLKNRVHLRTGLIWNRLILNDVPSQNSTVNLLVEHNEYVAETGDASLIFTDPAKSFSYGVSGQNDPIIQQAVVANVLHRLEIPIYLSKKIGNRWSASVGLTPSYQFSARSVQNAATFKRFSGSEMADFMATNGSNADQYSLKSVNNLLTQKLPRFDVAAGFSVDFALNRHWQTTFSMQQGLLNQSNFLSETTRIHQARVGLTRWF
jgi:hypothetical protein